MKFSRRTYKNPGEISPTCSFHPQKQRAVVGENVPQRLHFPRFPRAADAGGYRRKQLPLTAAYYHAKQALKSGLPQEEIDRLLWAGSVEGYPRRKP
jgi:hypothetical protein